MGKRLNAVASALKWSNAGHSPDCLQTTGFRSRCIHVCSNYSTTIFPVLTQAWRENIPVVLSPANWPTDWYLKNKELSRIPADLHCPTLLFTSGSGGRPKACIHSMDTLWAAAESCMNDPWFANLPHSLIVLPAHHVGGLMPLIRSAAAGGTVRIAGYRDLSGMDANDPWFAKATVSVVATQLQRLWENPGTRRILISIGGILLGGGPPPVSLLNEVRAGGGNVAVSYGMTETAALIAIDDRQHPKNTAHSPGARALGHVRLRVQDSGQILVTANSVCYGYLNSPNDDFCPADGNNRTFLTRDVGRLTLTGRLQVWGRLDRAFFSGGETVHPEMVERAALQHPEIVQAHCFPMEDADWGQAAYLEVVSRKKITPDELLLYLRARLPRYAIPKKIQKVSRLSRKAKLVD